MKLISFYPGPSRVYSNIPEYLYEAYMDGVLSFNHRSDEFSAIMSDVIGLLHEKLLVPKDYKVVFLSSATECWEVIAQSLTEKKSFHFYNGAFGEKWMRYAKKLRPKVSGKEFDREKELPSDHKIDTDVEVICITSSETSNGTMVRDSLIAQVKANNPKCLVAVDATSSMAGVDHDFTCADIWYASVQKCFGLPAGMAVMILSPAAVERSAEIGEDSHYNSLNFVLGHFDNHQTPFTPNVMDIYLLKRTLEHSKGAAYVYEKLLKRRKEFEQFIEAYDDFRFLIKNDRVRSDTVFAIKHKEPAKVQKLALGSSIMLGSGYAELKKSTFRVANFPAIKKREVDKLRTFFKTHF
ncbi:MAG: aminotransferase class V-fold PLP-dependent enzyme [Bacteroidota bacterium]